MENSAFQFEKLHLFSGPSVQWRPSRRLCKCHEMSHHPLSFLSGASSEATHYRSSTAACIVQNQHGLSRKKWRPRILSRISTSQSGHFGFEMPVGAAASATIQSGSEATEARSSSCPTDTQWGHKRTRTTLGKGHGGQGQLQQRSKACSGQKWSGVWNARKRISNGHSRSKSSQTCT